ncbi:hypothetical protein EJB05_18834 [Eragrostis curvula]|uniref:Crossover junction endonuclease MUS81 n=1 Tax=Eragrostis curvula TaxID=38414 RepID=A0A5J9VMR6_9POAL|nr:hypothetical protein EJB05_18834 [Eragrostis curvula]
MAPPVPKALPVPKQLTVQCPENEALSRFFLEKWREMMDQPGGLSENPYLTFAKANRNLCASKEPIRTLQDFKKIKGVGEWLIRIMKGFFEQSSQDLSPTKGNKSSRTKPYVPRKNTAAYAILITLHRSSIRGQNFMKKQELIDAAEASGLSQGAIGPDKYKGKKNSPKDWYTGWSCMTTLQSKGLVARRNKPLGYSLTQEGHATARDCLSRAGLDDSAGLLDISGAHNTSTASHSSEHHSMGYCVDETKSGPSTTIRRPNTSVAGHAPEVVRGSSATKRPCNYNTEVQTTNHWGKKIILSDSDSDSEETSKLKSSTKMEQGSTEFNMLDKDIVSVDNSVLAMPPRQSNESFNEAYEVVLTLDNRENFGSRTRKVSDNIFSQFQVPVEVKSLPVGDGIWIARDRKNGKEYVLDFIVERKNVSDLHGSIMDNRYRDQKLRLKRCGLKKLIYLVEGDPNRSDASEMIKKACFTTEVLDGFDVQRTDGYTETERRYGALTRSIIEYYKTNFSKVVNTSRVCPTYDEFTGRCRHLAKKTVSQIFALQLMQVPQVTEEAALAVIELYPTLMSLVRAYSMLEGDTRAQEMMLQNKSKMVNAGASRNIFKLVCSDESSSEDLV